MPSGYNFFQRYPEKMTDSREIWTKGGKISTINEEPVPEKIMQNETFRRLLDSVKLINFNLPKAKRKDSTTPCLFCKIWDCLLNKFAEFKAKLETRNAK